MIYFVEIMVPAVNYTIVSLVLKFKKGAFYGTSKDIYNFQQFEFYKVII